MHTRPALPLALRLHGTHRLQGAPPAQGRPARPAAPDPAAGPDRRPRHRTRVPAAARPSRHRLGPLGAPRPGGHPRGGRRTVPAADRAHRHPRRHRRPRPRPRSRPSADTARRGHGLRRPAAAGPRPHPRRHRVSVRTLHRAFADGESVMAYVRRRRLESARRELDHPGGTYTVADVASRWQFADPSHFRRAYRNTYGQPPRRG
ncbi:helix-turn-helix domain-containing protein [Streptomyces hyaluromycini]|uniref:Helix-turn-helix domain-containing protein n=1 Tax=Streptomyces hyaluromycini TaxID=1377993 RepID=A0ABV1X624_9ACTN